jgi:hypothetical protein
VATGKVTDACYPRHRHQEFLKFLQQVAKTYPHQDLHVVCDNYRTQTRQSAGLAGAQPADHVALHPTSGSWLNMVEIFFRIITRQAIRRGSFTSVKELIDAIRTFIDGWNDRCHPFTWTKDADTILAKAQRSPKTKDEALTRH